MNPSDIAFWDTVDALVERHGGYRREAYGFLVASLSQTALGLPAERRADPVRRHLTGAEVLAGIVRLARTEFGPLAPTVFREWGVTEAVDVGHMVFRLVEAGALSARPEDSLGDFQGLDLLVALASEPDRGAPHGAGA